MDNSSLELSRADVPRLFSTGSRTFRRERIADSDFIADNTRHGERVAEVPPDRLIIFASVLPARIPRYIVTDVI